MNDVVIVCLALIIGALLIVGGVAFYASVPVAAIVAGGLILFMAAMYLFIDG